MADDLASRIREARLAKGWSQQRLADAAGVTQSTIDRIEGGGAKRSRFLAEIYRALDLTMTATGTAVVSQGYRPPPEFFGDRDFPVYAAAEGGPGEMVVSTDPIELVPRPWFMREVKDGYAVLIVGESMEPVFDPGDMAIVNPRLPAMRGKDAIFVQSEEDTGEFKATIKRLVRSDTKLWHVRQFNEPREFVLDRREWPRALRVVGKLNGG